MPVLNREDLAAFVALWPRAYVPSGMVTESTLKVIAELKDLARDGGILVIPQPRSDFDEPPPSAPIPIPVAQLSDAEVGAVRELMADDDIPF